VALVSRIDKIIGLFCKSALSKRRYSAKENYNLIDPTNPSHPVVPCCRSLLRALFWVSFVWTGPLERASVVCLFCVALRCSALHCIAVCCRALQCVDLSSFTSFYSGSLSCCTVLQCVAPCCSVLTNPVLQVVRVARMPASQSEVCSSAL